MKKFLYSIFHGVIAIARGLPRKERRVVVGLLLILVIGIIWGSAAFIKKNTETIAEEGGIYREGAVGQPRYVTPVLARTNDIDMNLSRLVYSGLLKINEEGKLIGDLAEKVDVSEEGKVYTVTLKENIKWHDGEPFSADDVIFTIQTIQNPDTKSPSAPSFQEVKTEKIDDKTVKITLSEPYSPFMYNLTIGIVPEHIWAAVEPQNISLAEQNLKPIGTGPFMFKKLRKESMGEIREYELGRYEDYYGKRPYLDGITFAFYRSNDEMLRGFINKSIDGIGYLSPSNVKKVEDMRNVTVNRFKMPQYFAVFFNQTKNDALAEKVVRTALNLSVDKKRIIEKALNGEGVRIDTPIPPGSLGHAENLDKTEFNPEKARQNLEEAGWKKGEDGIREKDGTKISFNLITTDMPEYITTAEILADNWRGIGVEVNVQPKTVGTIQGEIIRPREYEALLYGQVLGADPDPYPFWHSTQTRDPGLNLALYKDEESDPLLEKARKTTDPQTRKEIYVKFQERMAEKVPAVFLYSPLYLFPYREPVGGPLPNAVFLPAQRFNTVSSWYKETKRVWKTE